MKSLTKSIEAKLVSNNIHVQLSLPVAGVLQDVQSAFFGLCVTAGKQVHTAMMEADRMALCGPRGVADPGIDEALYRRTLRTTNPIENLNGLIAHYTRNVKRWRDGQMLMRWTGSAIKQAAGGFRRVHGHRNMRQLISALKQRVRPDSHTQLKVA